LESLYRPDLTPHGGVSRGYRLEASPGSRMGGPIRGPAHHSAAARLPARLCRVVARRASVSARCCVPARRSLAPRRPIVRLGSAEPACSLTCLAKTTGCLCLGLLPGRSPPCSLPGQSALAPPPQLGPKQAVG